MLEIKYVPIDTIYPHPENPRTIDQESLDILKKSIQDNPQYFEVRPILVNANNVIFAGNMRYQAAKQLGMSLVPVATMDISPEKQRELMIRDNISNGQYDWSRLANNFEFQELAGWGMNIRELQHGFDLNPNVLNQTETPKTQNTKDLPHCETCTCSKTE